MGFWHALLDPKNGNNSEVDPAAWKSAQDWVESGAFAAEVKVECLGFLCQPGLANTSMVRLAFHGVLQILDFLFHKFEHEIICVPWAFKVGVTFWT